jgi:hypothetical protein
MIKNRIIPLLSIIAIALLSCDNSPSEELGYCDRMIGNASVLSKGYIFNKGENCYFPMKNGERHGLFCCFYKDTQTKEIDGEYKEGKKAGKWTFFYRNGNPEMIRNYRNDEIFGEFWEYDSLGALEVYGVLSPEKTLVYGIEYESGEIKKTVGTEPFWVATQNSIPLHTNEKIIFEMFLGSPPGYSSELYHLKQLDMGRVERVKLEEGKIKGTFALGKVYLEPGNYSIFFVIQNPKGLQAFFAF